MNHHEEREEHEGKEFDTLSRQVIGCAIEVHRFPGPGLFIKARRAVESLAGS